MSKAKEAICASIERSEIVWLEWSMSDYLDLLVDAGGWVEANGFMEFWGTRNGAEWRVHIEDQRAAEAA